MKTDVVFNKSVKIKSVFFDEFVNGISFNLTKRTVLYFLQRSENERFVTGKIDDIGNELQVLMWHAVHFLANSMRLVFKNHGYIVFGCKNSKSLRFLQRRLNYRFYFRSLQRQQNLTYSLICPLWYPSNNFLSALLL